MNWKTPAILAIMLFIAAIFVVALESQTGTVTANTVTSKPVSVTIKAPEENAGIPLKNIMDVSKTKIFIYTKLTSLLGGFEGTNYKLYPVWDKDSLWRFMQRHCFNVKSYQKLGTEIYVVVDEGKCAKTHATALEEAQNPLIVEGVRSIKDIRVYGSTTTPNLNELPWEVWVKQPIPTQKPIQAAMRCTNWEPVFSS